MHSRQGGYHSEDQSQLFHCMLPINRYQGKPRGWKKIISMKKFQVTANIIAKHNKSRYP